jgi:hypothetical protein
MQNIDVQNWEHFEGELRRLTTDPATPPKPKASRFLFRGQPDPRKHLTTTLERNGQSRPSFKEYFELISRVRPQIETFTGTSWTIPDHSEYDQWLKDFDSLMPCKYPAYDYMVYLRHHGFPSPLLDWSRSVYVAAYFAFREPPVAERVSIFVFLERPEGFKTFSIGSPSPSIWRFGPYVRSHRRHFLQQSDYTMCIVRDGEWRYAAHEDAFARDDAHQDLLWKFNVPSSERLRVLQSLDAYNLNAFSLFGSEESLMETMALRELHLSSLEGLSNQALQPTSRAVSALSESSE